MSHPWHHAGVTARKFGGLPEEHLPIHTWFDQSKAGYVNYRHRAVRHHAEGVFWCEAHFGPTITVTTEDGPKQVPTRLIAEDHVAQDLGWIPSLKDWLSCIDSQRWMRLPRRRKQGDEAGAPAEQPNVLHFNVTERGTFPTWCSAEEAQAEGFLTPDELARRFDRLRSEVL